MRRRLIALATAATLGLGATAPSAQTLEMGYDMLTGAVYNMLVQRGLPTDKINDLSLQEIAQIKGLLDGGEPEGQKDQRIRTILDKSGG